MPPFVETLKSLPARSKAAFAVAAVAIVAIVLFMLQLASAPSYATLASGLEPSTTGKVTAALDEQGIDYELQANGTAVAVEKSSVAKARIAMATAGVNAGAGGEKGFELFDESKLGQSEFEQKIALQRALEGEISNAVTSVDGVTGAKVQLVMPEEELFAYTETPATAAVMLEGATDNLEADSVRGIAQLVSSSVKSLKPANVTITDSSGRMLWPQGDGDTGGALGSTQQGAEGRYERQLEAELNAMLTRTLGPNAAEVQVKADLNLDETTRETLTYAKKGVPMEVQEESERLRGGGVVGGGRAGTAGNMPPTYGGAVGAAGNSNYRRESSTTKVALDKNIERSKVATGDVNRQSVALAVSPAALAAAKVTLEDVQAMVARAAGVDEERGDVIEGTEMVFPKPAEEPKAGPVPVAFIAPLKWAGLGVAALIFLFLMWRNLRKRETAALPHPEWLTQIQTPTPLSALEAGTQPALEQQTMVLPEREPNFQLQAMEQVMEREPERVAQQVKAWMSDDR